MAENVDEPLDRTAAADRSLPVAPSMEPTLQRADVPAPAVFLDVRVIWVCAVSMLVAVAAAWVAKGLSCLIGLITNLVYFGRVSAEMTAPGGNHLGWWAVCVPVGGGILVGLMARYGSSGIRGHGIPEAMERVLLHQSRIPGRLTFLKPLSAAIAIGTGGPFGAEGPIIATGGAMGSLVGQILSTTADERKTLLAAGAAAGMAATFGSPVSALLLAIELLLFEYRPRSFLPVGLASVVAAAVRFTLHMPYPVFAMTPMHFAGQSAMGIYVLIGGVVGAASVYVTRSVYWLEDMFEHLPVHWMWWPAIGAVGVGVIGHYQPHTLGVGYENISDVLSSRLTLGAAGALCAFKLISWSIALGSGTSGGTLAPLFTIGGTLGMVLGVVVSHVFPGAGVSPSVAALVGMAAMFAGASRAMLASAVFAFETTLQPLGLLPLLGGCSAAYLVSALLMRHTIMTEKIARRGVHAPAEFMADPLSRVRVSDVASFELVVLNENETVRQMREKMNGGDPAWMHQGFPVVNDDRKLVGVLTRKDVLKAGVDETARARELIRRPPSVVYADLFLREAADHMLNHDVGRLPVIAREPSGRLVGIITRGDLLRAHRLNLDQMKREKTASLRSLW